MKNEKFLNYIKDFLKQFNVGIELGEKIQLDGKFKDAVICGMGGSSIPGYMAEMINPDAQIRIHHNYDLPSNIGSEVLIICVSWSGNTEETISSYRAAIKNGLVTVAITRGGKLGELVKNNNGRVALLPNENIPPRMGVGYMYGALWSVLSGIGIIKDESSSLSGLEEKIDQEKIQLLEQRAKELAQNIGNKTPLIYSSFSWRNLGGFWKIFFNENSKIHAFWNSFPGMAHQEIAGFNENDRDKFFSILLKDKDDDPRHNESLEKLDSVLEELGYAHDTAGIEGADKSEKAFGSYILAALTSLHLAEKLEVDPESIELIEKFKKM